MTWNPHKFYWYHKKRGKHEGAIKEALDSIEANSPKNPWAYGSAIIVIINGNYNERDFREKHEAVKEEFTGFNEGVRELIKGVGQ